MKTSSSLQSWLAWRTAAAFIVGAAMIAGCGGVGTGGTGGTTVNTAVIAGKVADGYLVNALVFLDKNGNYQLDPGEPSTTSDQGGGYSLNVNPADIGAHPIVAVAIKGQTIDKDTGLTVANSYVLSAPASTVSGTGANFVSPISSQVRELMETKQYASLELAMAQVRTRMGLPAGTDVLADYKATNNTVMSTAAMNIASLMGSQMSNVLGTSGASITVDVNRYRGMVGSIYQNLSMVTAATTQAALSSISTAVTTGVSVIPAGQPFINMSSAFSGSGLSKPVTPISQVPFQTIKTGQSYTGIMGLSVLRTAQEWSDYWRQLNLFLITNGNASEIPPLPVVDFNSDFVIAVLNSHSSGGYSFNVSGITPSSSGITVKIDKKFAGSNCVVTAAFVYPYQIITTPVFSGDATLEATSTAYSCSN